MFLTEGQNKMDERVLICIDNILKNNVMTV